jgi:hypothetical protein
MITRKENNVIDEEIKPEFKIPLVSGASEGFEKCQIHLRLSSETGFRERPVQFCVLVPAMLFL